MKLVNITFAVSPSIAEDFTALIIDTLIPQLVEAGYYAPLLSKVCPRDEIADETDGCESFALQMRAPTPEIHNDYMRDKANDQLGTIINRWHDGVALFITELDVIYDPSHGTSC